MDDRTERLRDIFMDVAEDAAVTEGQEETRGSLAANREDVDDRLADVVERLRDRYGFETDLETDEYVRLIRAFYDGRDDTDIAADLDLDPETVLRARADLHLVEASDADVDLDALGQRIEDGADPLAAADDLGAEDPAAVVAVRRAIERSRRVSHRFRGEFEEILTDAAISVRLTAEAREDGLDEATADAEVDVDF